MPRRAKRLRDKQLTDEQLKAILEELGGSDAILKKLGGYQGAINFLKGDHMLVSRKRLLEMKDGIEVMFNF